ncbi:uncharacterized protein BYT42DRAFT_502665 [Radiomyces spectabilis]|uniref:uncharacterized protein n=1 Tax=Radiomyces spectabilis TaxID=64574 RepID=UPI00221ED532|nr:uncharacterized protein BYT42DRAFT_502665 [Radiomyces spectabilis]KAI8370481.1 hypothetical protein BYT42DRAFT_502665 [Radiomyces spectabilis]
MQSLARFTTCASSATFAHCYFQDDRTINRQLDTLYTNFLRYPSLIHVNGNPQHYLNAMRWRINIYMHAGYADLRYGAFVPRWKVQNFLTQLGKSGLSKERLRLADIYFTLWTNQYPWIVADPSMATETDKGAEIENFDRFDAMRRLQHVLEADTSDTPKDYIERLHESPALGNRDVKAACFNGQCLFTTNIDPFPVPHHVHFNASDMPSLHALENAYNSLDEMDVGLWTQYSFEKAVDQNKDTCWNTYRNPKAGDYFGLIIVGSIQADQLSIFSRQPISNQHDTWQVYVMQDDNEWITCRTSILDQSSKSHDATLQLDCGDTTRFRAIRVVFAKDQSEPFKLCGLRLDSLAV